MTVDKLSLFHIPNGALPIYNLDGPREYFIYRQHGWDTTTTIANGRALLSIEVDFLLSEFRRALPGLIAALDGLTEAIGTLCFAIRCCADAGGGARILLAAMAFIEGLPAPDLAGANAADLILQFCDGITAADSNTLHPVLQEALARDIQARAETEEALRQHEGATRRSRELLEGHLDVEQLVEFRDHGTFKVQLQDGRRFRFTQGFGHNVHLLEGDLCVTEYCIVTATHVPLCDQILAQKVLLEVLPDEFFRIANFRQLKHPTPNPDRVWWGEFANELVQIRHDE